MQAVIIHNNQTDEKHKGCNLRLNTATEHEETMSLGNEFQMLTIRSEKKLASRTDVVRCLYNLMEWPRVLVLLRKVKNTSASWYCYLLLFLIC